MNDEQERRLAELSKVDRWRTPEKLTRSDLLLLLQGDEAVQAAILRLMAQAIPAPAEDKPVPAQEIAAHVEAADDDGAGAEEPTFSAQPVRSVLTPQFTYKSPAPPLPSPQDPLREALSPELELLAQVQADEQLCAAWLGESGETTERQLVRLIAVASQWDQVLLLWDRLAARCKAGQRPASATERQILDRCLALHNLVWQGRQARLQAALVGAVFDARQHERGTVHGDTVTAEWLPGLLNAAGQLQKKPLVRT